MASFLLCVYILRQTPQHFLPSAHAVCLPISCTHILWRDLLPAFLHSVHDLSKAPAHGSEPGRLLCEQASRLARVNTFHNSHPGHGLRTSSRFVSGKPPLDAGAILHPACTTVTRRAHDSATLPHPGTICAIPRTPPDQRNAVMTRTRAGGQLDEHLGQVCRITTHGARSRARDSRADHSINSRRCLQPLILTRILLASVGDIAAGLPALLLYRHVDACVDASDIGDIRFYYLYYQQRLCDRSVKNNACSS